jgi:hypothetical protein
MDWNLDSLINGIDSSMESSGAVVIFDMNMDWSDFNNEVVVEVPEDAVLIPLGNMLPSAENF